MALDRRDFLRLASALGLTLVARPQALAQTAAAKRYWLVIHAQGAWDPASFVTPKGNANGINMFPAGAIKTAGNHIYAPYMGGPISTLDPLSGQADSQDYFDRFFQKYYGQLLVLNGMDTQTGDHGFGAVQCLGGNGTGYPNFGALLASVLGPAKPMAFTSTGGFDGQSLIGVTRPDGSSSALASLNDVAQPDLVAPSADKATAFQASNVYQKVIRPAVDARLRRGAAADVVLARQAQRNVLVTARGGEAALTQLSNFLDPSNLGKSTVGIDAMRVMLAAFSADIGVAGHMFFSLNTFDTHDTHDVRQCLELDQLFRALDFFNTQAQALNLADKVNVVVVSEFGRTPQYNAAAGKDHHTVTSALFMGADFKGNRVIGAVDDELNALPLNVKTLAPDPAGVVVSPAHLHVALRALAGIDTSANAQMFPLNVPLLPLFA